MTPPVRIVRPGQEHWRLLRTRLLECGTAGNLTTDWIELLRVGGTPAVADAVSQLLSAGEEAARPAQPTPACRPTGVSRNLFAAGQAEGLALFGKAFPGSAATPPDRHRRYPPPR